MEETLKEQITEEQPTAEAGVLRLENERLREQLRVRDAQEVLTRALAGAASPELLFAAAREMLQFDEDGRLSNTSAIVKELRARYPEQFRPPQSIGGGNGTTASGPVITKEMLAEMSATEIAKLDWTEVSRALCER